MMAFAFFVSVIFATLLRDEPRDQLHLGVRLFAGFVLGGIIAGWLLYPLPL